MQNMETLYTHSPADIRHYSTEQLRDEFFSRESFYSRCNQLNLHT